MSRPTWKLSSIVSLSVDNNFQASRFFPTTVHFILLNLTVFIFHIVAFVKLYIASNFFQRIVLMSLKWFMYDYMSSVHTGVTTILTTFFFPCPLFLTPAFNKDVIFWKWWCSKVRILPSGHICGVQWGDGWIHSGSPPCTSPLRPPLACTCPGTEGAACCHDTPL